MPDREALTGQSARAAPMMVRLTPEAAQRLGELADDAGMKRATLAAALLEELLPTVQGVRRRLQIMRNGRPEDG